MCRGRHHFEVADFYLDFISIFMYFNIIIWFSKYCTVTFLEGNAACILIKVTKNT